MPFKVSLPIHENVRSGCRFLGRAGLTDWYIKPNWTSGGCLRSVTIFRTGDTRGKPKIDVTLQLLGNGSLFEWEQKHSYRLEESQTKITLDMVSSNKSKKGEVLEGKFIVYFPMALVAKKPRISTQLPTDLLRLLNSQDCFADATLMCGDTEIRVHKCILSVRSPVFAAMFNQMQEAQLGIVHINDIEANVLQAMLKYVYSGGTQDFIDVLASDLLIAADKYQLEDLKLVCVDRIKSSLNADNVFHILVLGDMHDAGLKAHAKEFVCNLKFSELENGEGWKSFLVEHPNLAVEVLLSVVKHLQE